MRILGLIYNLAAINTTDYAIYFVPSCLYEYSHYHSDVDDFLLLLKRLISNINRTETPSAFSYPSLFLHSKNTLQFIQEITMDVTRWVFHTKRFWKPIISISRFRWPFCTVFQISKDILEVRKQGPKHGAKEQTINQVDTRQENKRDVNS